jgi:hypothetical protein
MILKVPRCPVDTLKPCQKWWGFLLLWLCLNLGILMKLRSGFEVKKYNSWKYYPEGSRIKLSNLARMVE